MNIGDEGGSPWDGKTFKSMIPCANGLRISLQTSQVDQQTRRVIVATARLQPLVSDLGHFL